MGSRQMKIPLTEVLQLGFGTDGNSWIFSTRSIWVRRFNPSGDRAIRGWVTREDIRKFLFGLPQSTCDGLSRLGQAFIHIDSIGFGTSGGIKDGILDAPTGKSCNNAPLINSTSRFWSHTVRDAYISRLKGWSTRNLVYNLANFSGTVFIILPHRNKISRKEKWFPANILILSIQAFFKVNYGFFMPWNFILKIRDNSIIWGNIGGVFDCSWSREDFRVSMDEVLYEMVLISSAFSSWTVFRVFSSLEILDFWTIWEKNP